MVSYENEVIYNHAVLPHGGDVFRYDDDTTSGRKEVSLLTITAAHDTLTTSFGEELVVNHLKIEQFGEELPLTYEWATGIWIFPGEP